MAEIRLESLNLFSKTAPALPARSCSRFLRIGENRSIRSIAKVWKGTKDS